MQSLDRSIVPLLFAHCTSLLPPPQASCPPRPRPLSVVVVIVVVVVTMSYRPPPATSDVDALLNDIDHQLAKPRYQLPHAANANNARAPPPVAPPHGGTTAPPLARPSSDVDMLLAQLERDLANPSKTMPQRGVPASTSTDAERFAAISALDSMLSNAITQPSSNTATSAAPPAMHYQPPTYPPVGPGSTAAPTTQPAASSAIDEITRLMESLNSNTTTAPPPTTPTPTAATMPPSLRYNYTTITTAAASILEDLIAGAPLTAPSWRCGSSRPPAPLPTASLDSIKRAPAATPVPTASQRPLPQPTARHSVQYPATDGYAAPPPPAPHRNSETIDEITRLMESLNAPRTATTPAAPAVPTTSTRYHLSLLLPYANSSSLLRRCDCRPPAPLPSASLDSIKRGAAQRAPPTAQAHQAPPAQHQFTDPTTFAAPPLNPNPSPPAPAPAPAPSAPPTGGSLPSLGASQSSGSLRPHSSSTTVACAACGYVSLHPSLPLRHEATK